MPYERVAQLLGGLGLFLLGMTLLTDGLRQIAGASLQAVLRSATRGTSRAVAAGAAGSRRRACWAGSGWPASAR